MIVQQCIKGVWGNDGSPYTNSGLTPQEAVDRVKHGHGLLSNWWRSVSAISPQEIRQKLTTTALDQHVNNYDSVRNGTPFISLTAGCVERNKYYRTNTIHSAVDTALQFATENGTRPGILFYCWVIVGLKPAVGVEAVAEEIRELNSYRKWSAWQLEGEIAAKINIPANQIERIEWWEPNRGNLSQVSKGSDWNPAYVNPNFDPPGTVSNTRELF
jgi:hypothetical protein